MKKVKEKGRTIESLQIWNTHNEGYRQSYRETKMSWRKYVESLDLGVVNHDNTHFYEVIDENKWALAKIKYGF